MYVCTQGRMDGWMDGWMDEWVDGWMDGWVGGWTNVWKNVRMDKWMGLRRVGSSPPKCCCVKRSWISQPTEWSAFPVGAAEEDLFLFLFIVLLQSCASFIHSFILAISIAPLQVLYPSEALPTTARILYRSFTPKLKF